LHGLCGLGRRGVRVLLLVLLSAFALTAGLLFDTTYTSHEATGGFGGIQGRYLFGALVPVFAAAAIGVGSLVPRRLERWLPAIVLPAVLASAAYGLWVAFLGFYRDVGWSLGSAWARMVAWSPFPGSAAVGLLVALVLLSLVAFGLAVWTAFRAPRDDVAAPTRPIPLGETPVPAA